MSKITDAVKLSTNSLSVDWSKILNLSVFDRFPDPVVVFHHDTCVIYINKAWTNLTGYTSPEVLGKQLPSSFWGADCPSPDFKAFKTSRAVRYQCQFARRDGHTVWVEVVSSPLFLNNDILGALTIWHNVSDPKESRAFNLALEDSPNPIMLESVDRKILYVNQALEKMTGFFREELIGKSPPFPWWPENRKIEYDQANESRRLKKVDSLERSLLRKDGNLIWVSISTRTIKERGKVKYLVVNWTDITERKNSEEALKASEAFKSTLLANSPNPILLANLDSSIVYANPALENLTGYSDKELKGVKVPYPWWPKEGKINYGAVHHPAGEDFVFRGERQSISKSGRLFWIEINFVVIKEKGVPRYRLSNWVDVTERKKTEEALKESQTFNASLLQDSPTPILVIAADGLFKYVNPAFEQLTGYSMQEVCGKRGPPAWWPKGEKQSYGLEIQQDIKSDVSGHERVYVKKNGERFWVISSNRRVSENGQVKYHIVNWVDVTERKKLEDSLSELYQKEKLQRQELEEEARLRGMFINVLAHELRTPITPILASSGTLVNLYKKKDDLSGRLARNIFNSAEILARRLEELLDMARYARGVFQLNLQPVELNPFFEQVVDRFKPTLKSHQILNSIISQSLPIAYIDASRIEQVVINLLSNAVKFSPGGGVITFKVEMRDGNICVEVKDQGIGISAEAQNRLFQPYYRVEQDQNQFQGLGLGLAVSKQIVEAHKGKIWVTSQKGKGSIFSFQIPVRLSE